jgi:hypothetical protein
VRGRDSEVRQVVSDLDRLLDGLRANVDVLNEILTRPVPPDADEQNERLVSP